MHPEPATPRSSQRPKAQSSSPTTPAVTRPQSPPPTPDPQTLHPKPAEIPPPPAQPDQPEPPRQPSDDPLLDSYCAAKLLGISLDLLEKWRRRDQGPDYIQYGKGGPARYQLSALATFIAAQRIQPTYQVRVRRRYPNDRS
jgi:hypothetical protein